MAKARPKAFSKNDDGGPLGGIFTFIGGAVGCFYAIVLTGGEFFFAGLIGLIVGGAIGRIVEDLVFRLILIALTIIMIAGRQMFFSAVFDSALLHEQPVDPVPYVQAKEQGNV